MNDLLKRLLVGASGRCGILSKVPLANINLGPEDELSVKVNAFMKDMLAQGRFRGIFYHVGNESGEGGRNIATLRRQQKKKALGMVPGAHDWLVAWTGGAVVVELKAGRGKLTTAQEDFAAWAEWAGVPARVARSVEEFEAVLVEVGAVNRLEEVA